MCSRLVQFICGCNKREDCGRLPEPSATIEECATLLCRPHVNLPKSDKASCNIMVNHTDSTFAGNSTYVTVCSSPKPSPRSRHDCDRYLERNINLSLLLGPQTPDRYQRNMNHLELLADRFIDETDCEDELCDNLGNYEYEEVTLQRNKSDGRLGLTLCYTSEDDTDTDIFITEIENKSIDSNDGRIKTGDQLLQVNGIDVHTRNDAVKLFSEGRSDFTLLLARSSDQSSKGQTCVLSNEPGPEDSAGSCHEKDSGISRSTDSDPEEAFAPLDKALRADSRSDWKCVADSSSREENITSLLYLSETVPSARQGTSNTTTTPTSPIAISPCFTTSNELSTDLDRSLTRTGEGSSLLSPECMSTAPSEPQIGGRLYRSESEGNISCELLKLNREMETIQVECDRLVQRYAIQESKVRQQVAKAHQLVASLHGHFGVHSNDSTLLPTIACRNAASSYSKQPRAVIFRNFERSSSESRQNNSFNAIYPPAEATKPSSRSLPFRTGEAAEPNAPSTSSESKKDASTGREETSSAYHSGGDSSRSTPLHVVANTQTSLQRRELGLHRLSEKADAFGRDNITVTCRTVASPSAHAKPTTAVQRAGELPPLYPFHKCRPDDRATVSITDRTAKSRNKSVDKRNIGQQTAETTALAVESRQTEVMAGRHTSLCGPYLSNMNPDGAVTMYTTSSNLKSTMYLQQRLLRQAMIQEAKELKTLQTQTRTAGIGAIQDACSVTSASSGLNDLDNERIRLQWKVKRRSDGSRYIVHRPVRNRLLKERAKRLTTQRQGITTDDDAASELKTGRYWSREERKRHLEHAKERKQRQLEILQRQALLLESATGERNNILELSHRMMSRKKCQQLTDRFTTIQEFLAHGSRASNQTLGILSVTTV